MFPSRKHGFRNRTKPNAEVPQTEITKSAIPKTTINLPVWYAKFKRAALGHLDRM